MRVSVQKEPRSRPLLLLGSLLLARGAAAFQASVSLSTEDFVALKDNPADPEVQKSTLLPVLTELRKRVSLAILRDADVGKVEVGGSPSVWLESVDNCEIEITALDVHAMGASTKHREPEASGVASFSQAAVATFLQNGPHIEFSPFTMDSQINISGSINVRYGTLLFNKCMNLLSAGPIPLHVRTSGAMQATLGLDLSSPRFEGPHSSPRKLVFDLHHSFQGTVERWNVNKVDTQGETCKVQLVGQLDVNLCDRVEDVMKRGDRIDTLMTSLKPAQAKLANLVKEKLIATVGTTVEVLLHVDGQQVQDVLYP